MKKAFLVLFPLLISSLSACGGDSKKEDEPKEEPSPKSVQVLLDNTFQHGIKMGPASGSRPDDGFFPDDRWPFDVNLVWGDKDKIVWAGAQHGDIYSFCDKYNKSVGGQPVVNDGSYTFEDESKKIVASPNRGAIYLELNASKEYTRPRRQSEQWCHLLLSQGFTDAVRLKECETVDFTIDLEMKKFEDHMEGKADAGLHATQFLMYLVMKSENAYDAGDFFWFGIPFFDNRHKTGMDESGLIDAGGAGATSKFIYGMDTLDYLPEGMYMNGKQCVEMDIKPAIARALNMAQTKFDRFTHSTIDDLTFQSMNIGFEIPGIYDCGIEISNFSLTANFKD